MNSSKIFIGGLNYNTTEEDLRQELEKFGKVLSIRIVTDFDSGRSKGFGFATFADAEMANNAIENLNNQVFDGRRIGVKIAIDKNR
jgi:RNA recognition motif-containing protein